MTSENGTPLDPASIFDGVRVKLWFCPVEAHREVRWDGDVATCVECGQTNEQAGNTLTIRQSGTVQVVSSVPAWAWRCGECGWVGTGWTSENGARREAADHLWNDHHQAACDPNELGPLPFPHVWKRIQGTDSTDQCERCGRYCGK